MNLEEFVKTCCIVHPKLSYGKVRFHEAFEAITGEPIKQPNLTKLLKTIVPIKQSRHRYLGIGKNSSKNQALVRAKMDITHGQACKLLSCSPPREALTQLAITEFRVRDNLSQLEELTKWLERKLYDLNLYRSITTKIGFVLYMSGLYTQGEAAKLMGVSTVTIREIRSQLGLDDIKLRDDHLLASEWWHDR